MNIPCPNYSPCEYVYPPYTNLSSEDPDRYVCIGRSWGNYQSPPRLNTQWTQSDCYNTCELSLSDIELIQCRALGEDMCSGNCVRTVSQELADICAANQTVMCPDDIPGCPDCPPADPNPDNPTHIYNFYRSNPYYGEAVCPDGSYFYYYVPRGTFTALSQKKADALAKAYGDKKARENRMCLSADIPTDWCVNEPFSTILTASAARTINTWTSSQLPSFLTLNANSPNTTATLSGTPIVTGTFQFTIYVVDIAGNDVSKTFTLNVVDILPQTASLPSGSSGNSYSTTISTEYWATAPLNWQVTSGSLPPGLALNQTTGVISGFPSTPGTYNFTISLQTSGT